MKREKELALTAVRCVCAAHAQVASLEHAVHQIERFLFEEDTAQWTLESASERGFARLLDGLVKHEWPGFNQKFRLLRLSYGVESAVKNGYRVPVLQWWIKCYMPEQIKYSLEVVCRLAISHGDLHILQWLVQEDENLLQYQDYITCRPPEVAYWLYEHDRQLPVIVYVDEAASLEHIQWCMKVQDDQATAFTIQWPLMAQAIRYSHINMLPRLGRPEPGALEIAIRCGRLDVAMWLHHTYPECRMLDATCQYCGSSEWQSCDFCKWQCLDLEIAQWVFSEVNWADLEAQLLYIKTMIVAAVPKGNLEVLQFLFDLHGKCARTLTEPMTELMLDRSCFDTAAANGHLPVVELLHNQHLHCSTEAMDRAAGNGHLDVVQWLHVNRLEGCTTDAMNYAAMNGRLDIVKWLHKNRTEGCSAAAMVGAAAYGHLDVIKWLHNNRDEGCIATAMDNAAKAGFLDVVQWLHFNRTEGCTTRAMDQATRYGHVDVVQFLHENRHEGCSTYAQLLAAMNGHLDMFKWFHDFKSERCPRFIIQANHLSLSCHPDVIEFAARHEGYISLAFAVEALVGCNRFATAEEILREAASKGTTSIDSQYVDDMHVSF